jgi:peptide/nickel transport system substrate-binding protein
LKFDALVDQAKTEIDVEKRRKIINEALMLQHDEFLHLPLHRQVIPWATRSNVTAVHRADNWVMGYWVKMDGGAP